MCAVEARKQRWFGVAGISLLLYHFEITPPRPAGHPASSEEESFQKSLKDNSQVIFDRESSASLMNQLGLPVTVVGTSACNAEQLQIVGFTTSAADKITNEVGNYRHCVRGNVCLKTRFWRSPARRSSILVDYRDIYHELSPLDFSAFFKISERSISKAEQIRKSVAKVGSRNPRST